MHTVGAGGGGSVLEGIGFWEDFLVGAAGDWFESLGKPGSFLTEGTWRAKVWWWGAL